MLSLLAIVAVASVLLVFAPRGSRTVRASASAYRAAAHISLRIDTRHPGRHFALGAVGLSIEADEMATKDLSADHGTLVNLMRLLGPGVLRLGGGSVDHSWWTSQGEPPPAWATSVVTPRDLAFLQRLLAATDWRAILAVNLGHFEPARVADETRVAQRVLGSRLLGFEVGNEPDDFGHVVVKLRPHTYSVTNYLEELAIYTAAMKAAVPSVRLYGPDISAPAWLPTIASARDIPFAAITRHYYPTSYSIPKGPCLGTPVPSAQLLLSLPVREREDAALLAMVGISAKAHRETLISETNNTSSCDISGGPETSPVFASALWALDWALRSASAGIAGINFHGYFGRCLPDAFSPICAPGFAAETAGRVAARPEYYGLLAARQLEDGRFLPIRGLLHGVRGGLTAFASEHPDSSITVAIDNLGPRSVTLSLRVPHYSEATSEALKGSALTARSRVTLGDASVAEDGTLAPKAKAVRKSSGTFRVRSARYSAVIVTLKR